MTRVLLLTLSVLSSAAFAGGQGIPESRSPEAAQPKEPPHRLEAPEAQNRGGRDKEGQNNMSRQKKEGQNGMHLQRPPEEKPPTAVPNEPPPQLLL